MKLLESLLKRDLIPEIVIRMAIRGMLKHKLRQEAATNDIAAFVARLKQSPIAIATEDANRQHYEVPPLFFKTVLGEHLKYSCGYWPKPSVSLSQSEESMLDLYCQRAQIANGHRILDLGCGWGSLSLYIAEKFPQCRITGVSNSRDQKKFIEECMHQRSLSNVEVITADMNHFESDKTYDRILSIEMFEHMRNYQQLMRKISSWLEPNGLLFVHIFVHRNFAYCFDDRDPGNWMARYFFTGGIMPSKNLLSFFQDDLRLLEQWTISGDHYQKTCEAWLQRMKQNRTVILPLFQKTYGHDPSLMWWSYWKIFFIACSELFGFRSGKEWFVEHYLFGKK